MATAKVLSRLTGPAGAAAARARLAEGLPLTVALLLFDGVEVLDACGPLEVLSKTRWCNNASAQSEHPFIVRTVATKPTVQMTGQLSVNVAWTLDDLERQGHEGVDVLLVPGGQGTRTVVNDPTIQRFLRRALTGQLPCTESRLSIVMSVCTGAALLGKTGLLGGMKATTHHRAFDFVEANAGGMELLRGPRAVDNGSVIFSAGISAGIDMSLYTVGKLLGATVAEETAAAMQYEYSSIDVA